MKNWKRLFSTKKVPVVTLFTKEECSLCEPVKFLLSKIQRKFPFEYREVMIDEVGNEKYFELYKYDIPVVHLQDREIARHRATEK